MAVPKEVFVGIDVAKLRNAVAIAEAGRDGEIRYMGEFDASPEGVTRLIRKLAARHGKLHVCYKAGPTGYGLYRQILALGHECIVVAPSLIPRRSGDRVKTNRRDAQSLARLLRAGELTAVWVPDETHEAVRDLVRTRAMAVEDYRRKRQHVSAFLLRHARSYVRIPLILISHSGRSRSPIPVILITLFTMPEEGTADSMTWRWTATTDG